MWSTLGTRCPSFSNATLTPLETIEDVPTQMDWVNICFANVNGLRLWVIKQLNHFLSTSYAVYTQPSQHDPCHFNSNKIEKHLSYSRFTSPKQEDRQVEVNHKWTGSKKNRGTASSVCVCVCVCVVCVCVCWRGAAVLPFQPFFIQQSHKLTAH